MENLHVLSSGPLPPNPAEWLGSKKMKKILEKLTDYADIVIIDTPPSLAVTDATVLAPQTDGVVLIARAGQTRKDALKETVEQMRSANANIIGVVLNDLDIKRSSYAYRYGNKNKYGSYSEYYGAGEKKR
jgi:capsular exopolysaccharide synthesis family protein